jgi:hypothetical protein
MRRQKGIFLLCNFLKRSHKGDARLLDFCERERDGTMIYCNLVCQVDTTDNVSQNYLPSSFLPLLAMCDEFSFVVFFSVIIRVAKELFITLMSERQWKERSRFEIIRKTVFIRIR